MPHVRVRDIDVYHERFGEGAGRQRVLLISGTGGDLRANPARGRGLLEQHYDVLMYDQRGLGRTGKPDVEYTMADYADDAAGLLDAMEWDRCHVVGVSFGGMVAQHVALRHPGRVDRLVLACTSSGGAGGSSFDLLTLEGLDPAERAKVSWPILDDRIDVSTDPPTLPPGLEAVLRGFGGPALNAADPAAAMGADRQLVARAAHDVYDRLGSITAPTLCIGGRFDRQAAPENMERLAAAIPGARLVLCDGGHLFLMQDPTAWPQIADFLSA